MQKQTAIAAFALALIVRPLGADAQRPTRQSSATSARGWHVKTTQNPLTDSLEVTLSVDASATINYSYRTVKPILSIYCHSGVLDVDFYLGSAGGSRQVRVRFDEEPVVNLEALSSSDLNWLIISHYSVPDRVTIVQKLAQAARLRVQALPLASAPVNFSFDVRGLEPLLPRLNRAGCIIPKPTDGDSAT